MKLTNTKEHFRIGFGLGVLAGFALPVLRLEHFWLPTIIAWAALLIGFELGQWSSKGFSSDYIRIKLIDSIVDIAVGLASFSAPVLILCLGLIGK